MNPDENREECKGLILKTVRELLREDGFRIKGRKAFKEGCGTRLFVGFSQSWTGRFDFAPYVEVILEGNVAAESPVGPFIIPSGEPIAGRSAQEFWDAFFPDREMSDTERVRQIRRHYYELVKPWLSALDSVDKVRVWLGEPRSSRLVHGIAYRPVYELFGVRPTKRDG